MRRLSGKAAAGVIGRRQWVGNDSRRGQTTARAGHITKFLANVFLHYVCDL